MGGMYCIFQTKIYLFPVLLSNEKNIIQIDCLIVVDLEFYQKFEFKTKTPFYYLSLVTIFINHEYILSSQHIPQMNVSSVFQVVDAGLPEEDWEH